MALMMLAVLLVSASFIAAETGHDCCGDDCPICECIMLCEIALRQIDISAALQAAVTLPVIFFCISFFVSGCNYCRETPVSRKVRLNN